MSQPIFPQSFFPFDSHYPSNPSMPVKLTKCSSFIAIKPDGVQVRAQHHSIRIHHGPGRVSQLNNIY